MKENKVLQKKIIPARGGIAGKRWTAVRQVAGCVRVLLCKARCVFPLAIFSIIAASCSTHHYYEDNGKSLFLYLEAEDAENVMFASSLDGYELHAARKVQDCWVVTVQAQRTFSYYYLVDGRIFVPSCRMTEQDDFGSENCVFEPGLL